MEGIELVVSDKVNEAQIKDADILFFNRLITGIGVNPILEYREKYGFKIVVDLDDYWRLSSSHILFNSYHLYKITEIIEFWLNEADAIIVTNEKLYNSVKPFNANLHILPNAIPQYGQFLINKNNSDYTRLFWAGGITHRMDIELLRNPLKKMMLPVEMVIGGYENHVEYNAMKSAYTNSGKLKNLIINSLPVEEYYKMYQLCDISLIPLVYSLFNSHKSNLKILEAANCSSPVIVSKVHPYLDLPETIVNYVEKQSDWLNLIKKLVENKNMATEQGFALKDYCQTNYNFTKINTERKQIFDAIINK